MPNIYNHISNNKRDTAVIIFLTIIFISFLGYFIGEWYEPGAGYYFIVVAAVYAVISSVVSYYYSDKIVLMISSAKKVEYEANPELHNLVDNLCIASGLKKPQIYMIDDSAMNAFATGRNPEHSVICFTRGIVEHLEKRELEGVVAHELSHIQNYDVLVMTVVAVMVGTITLVADFFTRGLFFGRRDRRSSFGGSFVLIGIVLIILSPLVAALIKALISRKREFLADSTAALLTRYPEGLADALRKLAHDTQILEEANGATAHMYIVHPLRMQSFFKLFDTHPPIEERIRRLESM